MSDDLVTRRRYLRAGLALEGMGGDASLVGQAADEIERLSEALEHAERDVAVLGSANVRLRALITEWAAAMDDKADSFGGLVRYENARVALREEANR